MHSSPADVPSVATPAVGALEMTAYFLKLGTVGFGGPIALTGYMRDDLVEVRRWVSDAEYREGLALAQLAPGPLAAQLAMYLGWVRGGKWGATLAGLAFVAPSLILVLALSALYVRYGGLAWLQGAFYGLGAATIAIIARTALKLARATLGHDRLLWGIFTVNAAVTAYTASEMISLIAGSGAVVLFARARPRASLSAAGALLPPWLFAGVAAAKAPLLAQIFWFFVKAGAVVFGSGLAIVPFLYGGVVTQLRWLTERQFLDAIAVSMITPGPVVVTVAFIGYLTAGLPGALVAAAAVFLPVYLVVVLTAARFHRVAGSPRVKLFVDGITAATTGAIAGAAVVLGQRAITDTATVLLAIVTLIVLVRWRRMSEPALLLVAAVVGILLSSELSP
jgi:chromate transporter